MKTGHLLKFKRRRCGKTNYKKRLNLVKSNKHRLIVRVSNSYINASVVQYEKDGDKTSIFVSSKNLKKFGWKHPLKNVPSAYLTGILISSKAKEKNIKECILDIGSHTPTKGARVFAVLKGAVDGGLNVPHEDTKIPNEKRLKGEHIDKSLSKDIEEIKKKILGKSDKK